MVVYQTFKYNSTCESCDKIQYKDKKSRITAKACFVLHEEVIDVFHEMFYITTIEKYRFILLMLGLLVQCNEEN